MASASKSTTLYCSKGYGYPLTASFTENSTSVNNNSSNVTCSASLTSSGASWSSNYNSTLAIYWHDNKENYDRLVASKSFKSLSSSQSVSGTIDVTHKDDGTLSGYAYAVFTQGSSSGGWCPSSGNVATNNTALTTIARASTPTITPNTFNIGDTITIKTNRKSTSFTHDVILYFGNYSYTIATGVTDSVTFDTSEVANNMYQEIPNASEGVGNVTLITYNGSTNVGSKYSTFTAKVVNSNPTFNKSYLDTNNTTTAITNNNQQIIRSNSTLQVKVTNAEAKNYASLSSAKCVINGVTYNASFSGSNATFNIGVLNLSSNTTAQVSVIDSRGITTTQNLEITILDWVLPTAIISLSRHNNFYSETDINVNADYSSLDNKNTITIKVRYKKINEGSYGAYQTLQDNVTSVLTLDNNYQWDVQVLVQDRIGSTTYNLTLSRGMPITYYDKIKSSTSFNCFPQYDKSVEIDGRLFVDNQDIQDKFTGIGGIAKSATTSDWNTACENKTGFFMGSNMSNAPNGSANWFFVLSMVHNASYQRQVAFDFFSIGIWTRIMDNGNWDASWTQVH